MYSQGSRGRVAVLIYHVTIGHGLLKKCWPIVIGCVLRTAMKRGGGEKKWIDMVFLERENI